MTELDKFINIFEGSYSAYGQTRKTEEFDERGKHKTRSFIIKKTPTKQMFQEHLSGKDPALGIIPINEENKCKWACIDIDLYNGFDHKELIRKIKKQDFPLVVCRSKSGGAHVFLFADKFLPAVLFRSKLKEMAAKLGYANAEIFPKQNKVDMQKGGTGSFLNLPYHNVKMTMRYAVKDDGTAMSMNEFFEAHSKVKLSEDQIFKYNDAYCKPPLDKKEVDTLIKSIEGKEYNYKCKDEPIASFCNSKKCVMQEFGVGDGLPETEIKEIQKYDSDPPLYYVTIGDEQVEVESQDLHEPDRFSLKCLEQIDQAMPPVGKLIWRKAINKLLKNTIPIEAPESTKIDVQLKELLSDYINKIPGKDWKDILRGLSYTEDGISYFKFKDFWKYIVRTKIWDTKKYPKQKTARMLETLFDAEEIPGKINNKSVRYMALPTLKLEKPNTRKDKMKEAPFA
jgi:hypothetical protein